jgi:large subunit ribosomal protein L24
MSWRQRVMKQLMKSGPFVKIPTPAQRQAEQKTRWNIVRGDKVQVIRWTHPEYGKQGIVSKVIRKQDRVIVEGVNLRPRRISGDPERGIAGQTISQERSIPACHVALVDPITNRPTRIVYQTIYPDVENDDNNNNNNNNDDPSSSSTTPKKGIKVRVSKKSGAIIPKPEILKIRRNVQTFVTPDCTPEDAVWEVTYDPSSSSS